MLRRPGAIFLAVFALLACGAPGCGGRHGSAGSKAVGEPCGADDECAAHLCVAGVSGDAPVCTRSCGRETDCPQGWYCSGVTARDVVVCSKASPTPFGAGGGR